MRYGRLEQRKIICRWSALACSAQKRQSVEFNTPSGLNFYVLRLIWLCVRAQMFDRRIFLNILNSFRKETTSFPKSYTLHTYSIRHTKYNLSRYLITLPSIFLALPQF